MNAEELIKIIPQYMAGIGTMLAPFVVIFQILRKHTPDTEKEENENKRNQNLVLKSIRDLWWFILVLILNAIVLLFSGGEEVTKSFIFFSIINGVFWGIFFVYLFICYREHWYSSEAGKIKSNQSE